MNCTHILLGRPWLFDKMIIDYEMLNTYCFDYDGRKVTILPMSPQEVLQDQVWKNQAKVLKEAKK